MLFLLFSLGRERYALEARRVLEVLSLMRLEPLPQAPRGVVGMIRYRGRPVPAVDLSELKLGYPAARRPGSRIVLTHCPDPTANDLVGLVTEGPLELSPYADGGSTVPMNRTGEGPGSFPLVSDRSPPIQRFNQESFAPATFQELVRTTREASAITVRREEALVSPPTCKADRVSAVIFRLEQEWLALPTPLLEQVAQRRPIHSLPHRREGVLLGLTNIRGELVVCFSLGHMLRLPKTASPDALRLSHERLVVLNREGKRLAFPVAEAHGPEHFHAQQLAKPPQTGLVYTSHLLPWRKHAVGLLDPEQVLSTVHQHLR